MVDNKVFFARVQILDGPEKGKKINITTKDIKHKFNDCTFKSNIKYKMKYNNGEYCAKILFLEDSKEKLESMIEKTRAKSIPLSLMVSDFEVIESDVEGHPPPSKKTKEQSITKTNNITRMSKMLKMDRGVLTEIVNEQKCTAGLKKNQVKFNKETDKKIMNMNRQTNDEPIAASLKINTKPTSSLEESKVDKVLSFKSVKDKTSDKRDVEDKVQLSTAVLNEKNCSPRESLSKKENSLLHENSSKENMENLKRKYNKVLEKYEGERHENDKLRKKNISLKKEIKELQEETNSYKKLNINLQKILTEKFDEQKIVENQWLRVENTANNDQANFPPIGYYRESDDTFHIGRNVRLSSAIYHNIKLNCGNVPSKFVGDTVLAVIAEDVLLNSSITGRVSNKTINKKKNLDDHVMQAKFQEVDQIKLNACHDFYENWLESIWKNKRNKNGTKRTSVDVCLELSKFKEYVGKKIAYLKRKSKTTKTSKKLMVSTEASTNNSKEYANIDEGSETESRADEESHAENKLKEVQEIGEKEFYDKNNGCVEFNEVNNENFEENRVIEAKSCNDDKLNQDDTMSVSSNCTKKSLCDLISDDDILLSEC